MPLTSASLLADAFTQAMDRLGPFEAQPALAAAVSGGADSLALALLARDWAAARGGRVLALTVDHGLRPESAREAALTKDCLATQEIPTRILPLTGLHRGPALAERARIARYDALTQACRDAGLLHLLLGHHAGDQAETLTMRVLRGSQSFGLAGMAALRETAFVCLLRPLLTIQPAVLRTFLAKKGIVWVEDPSNRDQQALRPRLRARMAPPDPGLLHAVALAGACRAREEAGIAAILAERVTLRPEGFALLIPGRLPVHALRALIRTIAGAPYPILSERIAELAADPRPATLGGVRIAPAGRLGSGLLVVREEAAIAAPTRAQPDAIWDGRFRLTARETPPNAMNIGKLGDAARRFRGPSDLPSAVLRTLPALWRGEMLAAVPHLNYTADGQASMAALFVPPGPLCGADFLPAASSEL